MNEAHNCLHLKSFLPPNDLQSSANILKKQAGFSAHAPVMLCNNKYLIIVLWQ